MKHVIKPISFLTVFLICFPLLSLPNDISATVSNNNELLTQYMTKHLQQQLTPATSLLRLKEGNRRFLNQKMLHRDLIEQAIQTTSNQYPFAVILNCMDSRNVPEFAFDQGLGDIFVIRIAGNIINNDILGSMEYATSVVGSKLIIVLGHTSCGAIIGACKNIQLDHLSGLIARIKPAISKAKQQLHQNQCSNPNLINEIAKDNVLMIMKQIPKQSRIIQKLITENKVAIVGGMYNIATGQVDFFE
jgi:carbonic anhydrase